MLSHRITKIGIALSASIFMFGMFWHLSTNNRQKEQDYTGGILRSLYRGRVVEKKSDSSLIVVILPSIIAGVEVSITERETEYSLIVGDHVEAVFDSRFALTTLRHVNVGDIVSIAFLNSAFLSFDFSISPIIVNCAELLIFDADGKTLLE